MPIEVAAYYFPNFHPDPRTGVWHGPGWTEWELLKVARPRFPGHRQPIVPAWGYFDESDPAWAGQEIGLAARHGITCFLYDWYWYEDAPFLQDALEQGFLGAPNNQRLKFALMWANHDWTNIQPAPAHHPPELLLTGGISEEVFEHMTDYILERYFTRPNYLTISGMPYFCIYDMDTFVQGLGGLLPARQALDRFRAKGHAAGFPGLHLNGIVWDSDSLPSAGTVTAPMYTVMGLGLDSVGSYTWTHVFNGEVSEFPKASYSKAAAVNYQLWDNRSRQYPLTCYPNVTMGWDSSPRTAQGDPYEPLGYPWTAVLEGNTPAAFRAALERAKAFVGRRAELAQQLVTINAWNEWTEGSYLLPDTVHGNAYVEAIRDVFATG